MKCQRTAAAACSAIGLCCALMVIAFTVPRSYAQERNPTGQREDLQRQLDELRGRTNDLEAALREQRSAPERLPPTKSVHGQQTVDDAEVDRPDETDARANERRGQEGERGTRAGDREDITANETPVADQRIEELEKSVQEFKGEQQSFVEQLSNASGRVVNGRIHLDQWGFPKSSPGINTIESGDPLVDPQDRFIVRRVRIGIRGVVPPANVSYRLEIENSGQVGGRIRDAWLGMDDLVFFNTLRFGNQKRPYGLDQLNSSNNNVFMERPFAVEAFNADARRVGLVSYGKSEDSRFNWRCGLFDMTSIQVTNQIIGDTYQPEFAGRLASTWWYDPVSDGRGYGHLAIAGSIAFPNGHAPNNGTQNNESIYATRPEAISDSDWLNTGRIDGAEKQELLAVESVFNVGAFQFVGELMNTWVQRDVTTASEQQFVGGYASISYFLTGEHIPWDRTLGISGRVQPLEDFFWVNRCKGRIGRGIGAWQVAARYSYADLSDDDILGGIGESLTLGLNWYWNSHTRLQFNYIWGRIDERVAQLAAGGSALVSGDYQITGVRFMLDF